MINTSNGSVNSENGVDSVGHANTVVSVDNPPLSGKDQDDMLEATGNCLVNRNFQWPWLTTPFPDSMLPPVSNHVSMLKLDPFRIYNRETGEPIGVNHSTGRGPNDSEFEDIELSSGSSTPSTVSTVYRVPVTHNVEVSPHNIEVSSPLLSDKDDTKREENHSESKYLPNDTKTKHTILRTIIILVTAVCILVLCGITTLKDNKYNTIEKPSPTNPLVYITNTTHSTTPVTTQIDKTHTTTLLTAATKNTTNTKTNARRTGTTTITTTTTTSTSTTTTTSTSTTTTTPRNSTTTTTNTTTTRTTTTHTTTTITNTNTASTAITTAVLTTTLSPTPTPRIHYFTTSSTHNRKRSTTRKWIHWGQ